MNDNFTPFWIRKNRYYSTLSDYDATSSATLIAPGRPQQNLHLQVSAASIASLLTAAAPYDHLPTIKS
jgi:hypothetical protein